MSGGPSIAAASCTIPTEAQYVSIRYTERFAETGIEPSVGSVGDPCDNALAETINGLCKARVRLHRDVLQPQTQARQERDAVTRSNGSKIRSPTASTKLGAIHLNWSGRRALVPIVIAVCSR